MKKILLVFAMIVCMTTCFVGGAFAQGAQFDNEQEIPWINYSIDIANATLENYPDGFYLCRIQKASGTGSVDGFSYDFVTAGGKYGTRAVLGNRGIKFVIESEGGSYKFKSLQQNPNPNNGQYLGAGGTGDTGSLFLDQNDAFTVNSSTELGNTTGYVYRITGMGVSNDALTTTTNAYWLIIPRVSFKNVLLSVQKQTNIEVSGLFNNTRFLRNIPVAESWKWYDYTGGVLGEPISEDKFNKIDNLPVWGEGNYSGTPLLLSHGGIESKGAYRGISPYIGNGNGYPNPSINTGFFQTTSYLTAYGEYGGAEMRDPIVMRQTVSGLKPGTYVITAEAFVSNDDDNPITTTTPVAYLFAAGTQGVNEGAVIEQLSEGDQTTFNGLVDTHYNYFEARSGLTSQDDYTQYFRRNVPASEFLATGDNGQRYLVTISVNVTGTGEDDGTLTIGVAKALAGGRVYVDNVRVFYSGDNEFGINAYSKNNTELSPTNLTGIDLSKYEFARVFNLSRDFGATTDENETTDEGETADDVKIKTPVWEALVMPVNLTKTQVRNTFGDDVKLCHLKGLDNGGSRIQFNTVNLSGNGNETAIYAGECYAVKVTDAPTFRRNDPRHEFIVFSVDENINNAQISYPSPVYQFTGVTRMSKVDALIASQNIDEDDVADTQMSYSEGTVTKTYKTADGNLLFTGYFYKPASVAKGNYVLNAGTVYHLTGDWSGLVGTMWTLQEVDEFGTPVTGSKLSIDFGDDHLTGITEISGDGAADVAVEGVYNLNGQKVSDGNSTDNLPKGIYVVNGRKVVVR